MLEKQAATPEPTYESCEALLEKSSKFYKKCGFWNPGVEAMLAYAIVENARGEIVSTWRKHTSDAYISIYFDLRLEDYYEHVVCPMIMLPEQDDMEDANLLDIMTRLSGLAKQCEMVLVPGHIHPFGWMLAPEPVSSIVLAFYAHIAKR